MCVCACVRVRARVCCVINVLCDEMRRKMDIRCVILQVHYYQPMFTLVGGGLKEFDDTHKSTQSVLPSNCDWLQTSVEGICPNENTVSTTDGRLVGVNNISIVY